MRKRRYSQGTRLTKKSADPQPVDCHQRTTTKTAGYFFNTWEEVNENQSVSTAPAPLSRFRFRANKSSNQRINGAADSDEGFLSESHQGRIHPFAKRRVPGVYATVGEPPECVCREDRIRAGHSRDQRESARHRRLRLEGRQPSRLHPGHWW